MGAFAGGLILMRVETYPKAKELSGPDVLVLAALVTFAADDHLPVAYPSVSRIVARTRLGRRTVQRALDHLEKVGVVVGERRPRRPTRWTLDPHFTRDPGAGEPPVPQVFPGGSDSANETSSGAAATPAKRRRDASQASERRLDSARAAHERTEVRSEAKRRNRTDVSSGGSGKPARSARRAPSAAPAPVSGVTRRRANAERRATQSVADGPPKREPPPAPKLCCPHGVSAGHVTNIYGKAKCPDCDAMAPDPRTETFNAWCAAQDRSVVEVEVTCSDEGHERVARSLARGKFDHALGRKGRLEYSSILPRQVRLWHAMKAYAVEQVEPGRVAALVAAHKATA